MEEAKASAAKGKSTGTPLWEKALAEFLGTALLVFFGCISGLQFAASADLWGKLIAVSAAFGIIVTACVYTIGGVSGAHLNPAASLAMALDGRITWKDFFAYVGAQIGGAFVGALVIWAFLGSSAGTILSTEVNSSLVLGSASGATTAGVGSLFAGMFLEAIGTCVFIYVVLAVTAKKENGPIAGLVIGAALWLSIAILFNLTGGSLNPARSLGTALVSLLNGTDAVHVEPIREIWVYIFGPLMGGAAAAGLYKFFNKKAA